MDNKEYFETPKKKKNTFLKVGIIIIVLLMMMSFAYSAYAQNDSCSGDLCSIKEAGYTYEDNLNDSKCYYNINFCNLDFDPSSNISVNAITVLNTLKQVNYQMQDQLKNCTDQINKIKYINSERPIPEWILIILLIIAGLWAIYVTYQLRRKNENK